MTDEVISCLSLIIQSQNIVVNDVEDVLSYLSTEWNKTKTEVVIELNYHPCHIIMAYMLQYQKQTYQHAGKLVEVILELVENEVPVFDVDCIVQYFVLKSSSHTSRHYQSFSYKERLIHETMHMLSQMRCKLCFKNEADQLIMSCGHLSLCTYCLKEQSWCPICDSYITNTVKVYTA